MKKTLAILLSTSLMLGTVSPALARDNDRHDNNRHDRPAPVVQHYQHNNFAWNHHDDHRRHDNNNGWGIAFGILAAGTALAIANDAYSHPVYVQPQPIYRPVTVSQTIYEPHTVYRTVYQPVYAENY